MENAIMQNNLQSSLRGGVFTTLNINDEHDADLLLATQDNDDMKKINDVVGNVLEVVGLFIKERKVEDTNNDGEVIEYYKHTTILFTKDGEMYVTGSNSFYMSLDMICAIKGNPSKENPIKIKVSQTDAEIKGHKYLKAVYVK